MSGMESDEGKFDLSVLWQALAELEAGELSSEQRDELMALVHRSPAAQRAYLEYFEMTAILEAEASTHAEQGKLPVVGGQRRLASRMFRRSVLAAAAVLVLSAIGAAFFMVKQSEAGHLAASSTAGAEWTVDGLAQDPAADQQRVAEGSSVRVWSGMVELKLESGVVFVMQGPAHVSFPKMDRPTLHEGWLWVDSDAVNEPLEVVTPELLVSDIGTRFGVMVSAQDPAEIHLVEGKVEVFAKATNQMVASLETEERGVAISGTGESSMVTLARDPFPELPGLMIASANYPTTVRSQNPVGYWRLEDHEPGLLKNEVPEGLVGRHHPSLTTNPSGPGSADGFRGFGEGNRSVSFSETSEEMPISLGTTPVHDGVLFQDDFSETGGGLHGVTPDITTCFEKWTASPAFNRDGSINALTGSATLAFVPVDGVVYTLDASLTANSGPSENWIALGFSRGQSREAARFGSGGLGGRVWMLHRAADTTKPVNRAWLSTSASDWNWPSGSPLGGPMDMRVVLDTTGGAGAWTATWFAKRPADETYTMVRDTEQLINESINSVGFSVIGENLSASVERFELRADRRESTRPNADLADGPARVARKEGAVSFWVRSDGCGEKPEILWAAGEGREDASIHAHLTADGRAGFFMENGRYDVLIASEHSIDDGKWHHLVASWSSSSVDLYVDGLRVANDTEFRGAQQGILPELRFGSADTSPEFDRFTGSFDEIAIWDRYLTAAEVAHQFRSAKGE
ncbi:LamG-like jellyroll fold domain-containing protein [Haloferula sp.]|uniref:LamG-like jellyroll fold domain-containing protein n=1 Tax=Haloferula sp. TaxID=2497595 RepID=UPI003C74F14A